MNLNKQLLAILFLVLFSTSCNLFKDDETVEDEVEKEISIDNFTSSFEQYFTFFLKEPITFKHTLEGKDLKTSSINITGLKEFGKNAIYIEHTVNDEGIPLSSVFYERADTGKFVEFFRSSYELDEEGYIEKYISNANFPVDITYSDEGIVETFENVNSLFTLSYDEDNKITKVMEENQNLELENKYYYNSEGMLTHIVNEYVDLVYAYDDNGTYTSKTRTEDIAGADNILKFAYSYRNDDLIISKSHSNFNRDKVLLEEEEVYAISTKKLKKRSKRKYGDNDILSFTLDYNYNNVSATLEEIIQLMGSNSNKQKKHYILTPTNFFDEAETIVENCEVSKDGNFLYYIEFSSEINSDEFTIKNTTGTVQEKKDVPKSLIEFIDAI
ncbi:hypothetical protein [Flammeovirga kamogawensis]|uniref:DUF4595 domain-containing protein n=1 Tax=Flammeovirga kamogawensis TaxID=373891 RepID=A0ABX8H3A9_9BACT|nr:hypothetical protein [Flammeovirga kamogawensis]MBB6463156.1 hypothetical protein [Flammeovirga kamogawensis]QWG10390.1 hypothetical protein KM029_25785 [Flammeovirga kamogawensis]TRX63900.1 hypothetical protein EO216_26160 [Flammeovirga kamogawensis]